MILANPIYDVVFKYLMEDTEIARGLLSKITEEELVRKIEIEEEVENTIEQHIREKQELAEKVGNLKDENVELKKRLEELEQQLKNKK